MSDVCAGNDSCETGSRNKTPDLLVIGAGSAGFSAAITAAGAGADVLFAGEGTIGGTCVNVGCVPSKTLIRAVETIHQAKSASRFNGISGTAEIFNWKALIDHKQQLVESLRKAKYIDILPSYPKIDYVEGKALFTGNATEVEIDGRKYHPKKIVIATGSSTALPPIDGIQGVPILNSTTALELEKLPKSILVIGGGYIGSELGQMFARAGVKVTICFRSRLLPEAEPELSEALSEYFKGDGITVLQGIRYKSIEKKGKAIKLHYQTQNGLESIEAEQVIVATGRRANSGGMNIEKMGIKLLKNGGIEVNEFMQTTNPNIYAAGDVTGKDMFVYMAAYGGKLAAGNALEGNRLRYDSTAIPSVTFTDPQVASVGLTEAEAKAKGYGVKTSLLTLDNVPRFIAARNTRGLIKLVADKSADKILGAHILAPEGGDSIQTMVMAIKAGLTTEKLANTIFPYLTAVEGLKLAAQTFHKDVSNLPCCAG
ncbi:MAG: mercury(II) reductase [Thermodesulfobacteriota bacterium]